MKIIKANSNDAKLIAALADEIWRQHYPAFLSAAQIGYMLAEFQSEENIASQIKSGGMIYYILFEGEIPAGYCGIAIEDEAVYLSKLYIKQGYRGKGLSKLALSHIQSVFADKKKIYLHVDVRNAGSIAAYEKMGFVNTGFLQRGIGGGYVLDDYTMERRLN